MNSLQHKFSSQSNAIKFKPLLTGLMLSIFLPACVGAGGGYSSTGYVMLPLDQQTAKALPSPRLANSHLAGACRNTPLRYASPQAEAVLPMPGYIMPLRHWSMYHAGSRAATAQPSCSDMDLMAKMWQSAIGAPITGALSEQDVAEYVRRVDAVDPRFADTHKFNQMTPQDKSVFMYKSLAENGDAKAQARLGAVYEAQGNLAEAEKWYQRSAAQGQQSGHEALYNFRQKYQIPTFTEVRRKEWKQMTDKEKDIFLKGVSEMTFEEWQNMK